MGESCGYTWGAILVCFGLHVLCGGFGICVGYHRLLTHRSFKTAKVVEYFMAICGALSMQGGPVEWVAANLPVLSLNFVLVTGTDLWALSVMLYEAIAGHYPTLAQANAVANKARAKGLKAVVQVNRPKHIEVEYGNGYATPAPALALCKKVKAAGLPCLLGQEQHGVPAAWGHS